LVDGKLIGEGTPKEYFCFNLKSLEKANLKVPIVTDLFQQLEAEQGFDMEGDYPLTIDEAKEKFLKLLNKN
jgi:Cobalt ATP-binding cassette C terminal.